MDLPTTTMSTDYDYLGETPPSPDVSDGSAPFAEPEDAYAGEETPGGSQSREKAPREPFVLLRSESNTQGGFDLVVPWLPAALKHVGRKAAPAENTYVTIGKRSLRVLSAAMVAHYYLYKDPALRMASVGQQVGELAFPIFVAYTTGVLLAPFGAAMYCLAGMKLLNV
jgi:hypothetical protein